MEPDVAIVVVPGGRRRGRHSIRYVMGNARACLDLALQFLVVLGRMRMLLVIAIVAVPTRCWLGRVRRGPIAVICPTVPSYLGHFLVLLGRMPRASGRKVGHRPARVLLQLERQKVLADVVHTDCQVVGRLATGILRNHGDPVLDAQLYYAQAPPFGRKVQARFLVVRHPPYIHPARQQVLRHLIVPPTARHVKHIFPISTTHVGQMKSVLLANARDPGHIP